MNRDEATHLLLGTDARGRLRAARWFAKHSDPSDHEVLRKALDLGNDHWTHQALQSALASLGGPGWASPTDRQSQSGTVADALTDEIYAEAVEETTAELVHELEPVLGVLKVVARREVPNYEASQTHVHILRLERVLTAIDTLRRAASSPRIIEIDLAEEVRRVSEGIDPAASGVDVQFGGPRPFIVLADQALVELALSNGIKNAIESTAAVEGMRAPVIVTWGDSDRDYFVTVLDEGTGIPPGRTRSVFGIGVTSKKDHLGMGLALAKQAITSLRGEVSLTPRTPRGAAYKFMWPRPVKR